MRPVGHIRAGKRNGCWIRSEEMADPFGRDGIALRSGWEDRSEGVSRREGSAWARLFGGGLDGRGLVGLLGEVGERGGEEAGAVSVALDLGLEQIVHLAQGVPGLGVEEEVRLFERGEHSFDVEDDLVDVFCARTCEGLGAG